MFRQSILFVKTFVCFDFCRELKTDVTHVSAIYSENSAIYSEIISLNRKQ